VLHAISEIPAWLLVERWGSGLLGIGRQGRERSRIAADEVSSRSSDALPL